MNKPPGKLTTSSPPKKTSPTPPDDTQIVNSSPRPGEGEVDGFSATLPPIAYLKHLHVYEQSCPGAARRVIDMAERSLDHKIDMERRRAFEDAKDRTRGMYIGGGLLALLTVTSFATVVITGSALAAGSFLGVAVLGSIGKLLTRR